MISESQIGAILIKKKGLTMDNEYIAAFSDGTVSDILTEGTFPHYDEGDYVRIFRTDNLYDIETKLGLMEFVENF